MPDALPFDPTQVHHYYSAECFNSTWNLLEKLDRSPQENEDMIACCLASLWHWRQRPDCTLRNLSIAYWQASRVYAVLGQAENARRYGELCLEVSEEAEPFYVGYALEALARAAKVAGDDQRARQFVRHAHEYVRQLPEGEDRTMLLRDLDSLS